MHWALWSRCAFVWKSNSFLYRNIQRIFHRSPSSNDFFYWIVAHLTDFFFNRIGRDILLRYETRKSNASRQFSFSFQLQRVFVCPFFGCIYTFFLRFDVLFHSVCVCKFFFCVWKMRTNERGGRGGEGEAQRERDRAELRWKMRKNSGAVFLNRGPLAPPPRDPRALGWGTTCSAIRSWN